MYKWVIQYKAILTASVPVIKLEINPAIGFK